MEADEVHCVVQIEEKQVSTSDKKFEEKTLIEKPITESDTNIVISDNNKQAKNVTVVENTITSLVEEPKASTTGKGDMKPKDIDPIPDKKTALSNNVPAPSNSLTTDSKGKESIDLRHPILSSIAEGEVSVDKHASLPVSSQKKDVTNSSGRRLTEPAIKPVKSDKNRLKSLDCKNMEITRVVSSERCSNRSGFGGTADFDGKKPSVTPSERLKAELATDNNPHPLIILPDDGKFWCDPPTENVTERKYFLSCFEMENKDKYKDLTNVVENPSEIAAETYVKSFSQVLSPE